MARANARYSLWSESANWVATQETAERLRVLGELARKYGDGTIGNEIVSLSSNILAWAERMQSQLAHGVHQNPPADIALGKKFSARVYSIAYKHDDDGVDYKHDFKPGVELWKANIGGHDGVVILGARGQAITEEF